MTSSLDEFPSKQKEKSTEKIPARIFHIEYQIYELGDDEEVEMNEKKTYSISQRKTRLNLTMLEKKRKKIVLEQTEQLQKKTLKTTAKWQKCSKLFSSDNFLNFIN